MNDEELKNYLCSMLSQTAHKLSKEPLENLRNDRGLHINIVLDDKTDELVFVSTGVMSGAVRRNLLAFKERWTKKEE